MGSEEFWENLRERLWSPITWFEILLLFLTMPLWVPILRALWREMQEVLAPYGGVYGRRRPRPTAARAPGEDPFAKIPIQRRRASGTGARRRTEGEVTPTAAGTSPRSGASRRRGSHPRTRRSRARSTM